MGDTWDEITTFPEAIVFFALVQRALFVSRYQVMSLRNGISEFIFEKDRLMLARS